MRHVRSREVSGSPRAPETGAGWKIAPAGPSTPYGYSIDDLRQKRDGLPLYRRRDGWPQLALRPPDWRPGVLPSLIRAEPKIPAAPGRAEEAVLVPEISHQQEIGCVPKSCKCRLLSGETGVKNALPNKQRGYFAA